MAALRLLSVLSIFCLSQYCLRATGIIDAASQFGAKGHFSGQKVTAPSMWPIQNGFDAFPIMWFGANTSGLDSVETLELISKHRVGGYGWQQGTGDLSKTVGLGETHLVSAATHLRDYLSSKELNNTLVFVYRQIQVALRLFETCKSVADNPNNEHMWLHDPTTGKLCLAGQPWHTSDPYWNFTNPDTISAWLENTITEVTAEASKGVAAVFFDEVDQAYCGYWNQNQGGCSAQSNNLQSLLQKNNNVMLTKMVQQMNRGGVIPLLSLDNRLSKSSDGLNAPIPCAIPEDATLDALNGLTWARFYENWPSSYWVPSNRDLYAAMISNAILEGTAGIPVLTHYNGGSCPDPGRHIPRPGRLGGNLEFGIATFLIVQTEWSVFSASTDWYDANFCWHPEYDVQYGRPLNAATRTGPYTWHRNFTMANVEIDVSRNYGAVLLI